MSRNNNEQEENEGAEDKSPIFPRSRRERSPSTISHSSAALEWDPSADVGAMGDVASMSGMLGAGTSHQYPANDLRSHQEDDSPPCNILFGPAFDTSGRRSRSRSRPSSRRSQAGRVNQNPLFTYSTPSASPVPLLSLEYSPVAPDKPGPSQRNVQENQLGMSQNRNGENPQSAPNVQDSSESNNNNNDELMDARRTPERVVSGASTDWEYGNEKKTSSRYVADWQTNGITRSEIEYQIKKKSGSSSSAASSVFLLQVEARKKNLCQGSPEVNLKKGEKSNGSTSNAKSTDSSDMELKPHNMMKRPLGGSKNRQQVSTSTESDPSSMCMVVNNFLKIVDENEARDNIKYDVLKTHRDYHMKKVWKQIAKLEKINRALLSYKTTSKGRHEISEASQEYLGISRKNRESVPGASQKNPERLPGTSRKKHEGYSSETSDKNADDLPGNSRKNLEESLGISQKNRKGSQGTVQKNSEGSAEPSTSQKNSDLSDDNDPEIIKVRDERNAENIVRKSPVGFFVPLSDNDNDSDVVEEKLPENELLNAKESKTIQECLKERNPKCYNNIKERDDFLITVKRERQVYNETLLRKAVQSNMAAEEIDEYLRWNYRNGNPDEQRRLKTFWEWYTDSQKYKENKENVETANESHVIPSKEMKERTQRLIMNDPVALAKQKMEADERKKKANRDLQKNFATNLRQYQRLGGVNIPDRLKLGPRPR